MEKTNSPLLDQDTYIFIDVSNMRTSCFKTLGLRVDFLKYIAYAKQKYPKLKDIRYYEGIAKGDEEKRGLFRKLKKVGYTVCSLERKSYTNPAIYKPMKCRKCGHIQKMRVLGENTKRKSNVDVYLATDLLEIAYLAKKPTHIILLSCDGDYAEMIKNTILKNENVSVSVVATPPVRDFERNTLSVRLRKLRQEVPRYQLTSIVSIAGIVEADPNPDKN